MSSFDFMDSYFGPLNLRREYCLYFYYVSVIFFVMFAILSLGFLAYLFKDFRNLKANFAIILHSISLLLSTFISYFVNRILYTMCVNSMS